MFFNIFMTKSITSINLDDELKTEVKNLSYNLSDLINRLLDEFLHGKPLIIKSGEKLNVPK